MTTIGRRSLSCLILNLRLFFIGDVGTFFDDPTSTYNNLNSGEKPCSGRMCMRGVFNMHSMFA